MKTKNFKIAFFGTPEVSAKVLERLLGDDFNVGVVITNEDKPVGRKQILTPPPTKVLAQERNITVLQPNKLDDEFINSLPEDIDIGVVVAYGKILPQKLIDLFPKGLINIHYSLLPKYRGASPVESAILNGDTETGVTIQKLVFKLDAGPIIASEKIDLDQNIKTPELKDLLTDVGNDLLIKILPEYVEGNINLTEQNESLATHCGKISKADGEIKDSDPDIEKWRKYRAYFPWPGIFYFDSEGKRTKITEATFENNKFIIKKIIPEGKNEISI